jgi:protein SCO1/2/putative membrane protein
MQDRFKNEEIQLVTLTVDPDRDTPDVLKTYAELNGADLSRWYFLHGDATAIYGLIHRSFQMPAQMPDAVTGNYQVIHSNNVMLVDQNGVVQGKYLGTNPEDVAKLARDLRRLLHPQTTSAPGAVEIPADAWYMKLPAINAGLNALATVLLAAGFVLIRQRRITAHRNVMLTAFAVSIVFLACYLVYHDALRRDTGLPGKPFPGTGASLIVYRTILVTHVILAAAVPFLASVTIYRGLKADWTRHRKIAKITFPIWMYVSVTGVIIYLMLYHWPVA